MAALVLSLTACAPSGATETRSPTLAESPTSTFTPTAAWPQPLVDTTCEDLVPQEIVDATFGVPLTAGAIDPLRAQFGTFWSSAHEYAGGLSCEWGAIDPDAPTEDRDGIDGADNWLSVAVDLIPRGAEYAQQIATEMDGSVPDVDPAGACDFGLCSADMLIGEYWVGAFAGSFADSYLPPTDTQQALFDHVAAVVGGLGASTAPVLPADSASWPTDCSGVVPLETLEATLDLTEAEWVPGYSYRSSNLPSAAVLAAGGQACGFAGAESGRTGLIQTLPGAGDAFAASAETALTSPDVSAVEVEGLPSGSAIVRVNPMVVDRAELEMNLHGTWVLLTVGGASSLGDGSLTASERVIALASAMAAV